MQTSLPIPNEGSSDQNQSRIIAARDFVDVEFSRFVSSEVSLAKNEISNLFQSFFTEYQTKLANAERHSQEMEKKTKQTAETLKKSEETILELRSKLLECEATFKQILASNGANNSLRNQKIQEYQKDAQQTVQTLFTSKWEEFLQEQSKKDAEIVQKMKGLVSDIEKGIEDNLKRAFEGLNEKINEFNGPFKEVLERKEEIFSGLQKDLAKKLNLEESWFGNCFQEFKSELEGKLPKEKEFELFERTCMDHDNEELCREIIQLEKRAIVLENGLESQETKTRTSLVPFETLFSKSIKEGNLKGKLKEMEEEVKSQWEVLSMRLDDSTKFQEELRSQIKEIGEKVRWAKEEIEEIPNSKEWKKMKKLKEKIKEVQETSKKNEEALRVVSQKTGSDYEGVILKIKEFEGFLNERRGSHSHSSQGFLSERKERFIETSHRDTRNPFKEEAWSSTLKDQRSLPITKEQRNSRKPLFDSKPLLNHSEKRTSEFQEFHGGNGFHSGNEEGNQMAKIPKGNERQSSWAKTREEESFGLRPEDFMDAHDEFNHNSQAKNGQNGFWRPSSSHSSSSGLSDLEEDDFDGKNDNATAPIPVSSNRALFSSRKTGQFPINQKNDKFIQRNDIFVSKLIDGVFKKHSNDSGVPQVSLNLC